MNDALECTKPLHVIPKDDMTTPSHCVGNAAGARYIPHVLFTLDSQLIYNLFNTCTVYKLPISEIKQCVRTSSEAL